MIKTLKDYLYTALSNVYENTHTGRVLKDDTYPLVTYIISTSSPEDSDRDGHILEINIWDKNPDTDAIDNIADSIESKLKKLRYLDNDQLLIFQKLNRLVLSDEKDINRIMLRYLIKREER